MTSDIVRRATLEKIAAIETIEEIDRRLQAIDAGKVSPGRPYSDEVRRLCRQRVKLTKGAR